ncbi:DUF2798 domain-containing protein [Phyllobacterium sp. K27]
MHKNSHLKLPHSFARFIAPLLLSIFMSAIVSAVATITGVGFGPDFGARWLNAWGASWIVAFPSLLVMMPIVRRIVSLTVRQP